jgi:hypothetical protein
MSVFSEIEDRRLDPPERGENPCQGMIDRDNALLDQVRALIKQTEATLDALLIEEEAIKERIFYMETTGETKP